jgi:hypothetical protein
MRGRPKLIIDAMELQAAINRVEANGPLKSLGELWATVCQDQWATNLAPRPLTAQVCMMRVKELNANGKNVIKYKTVAGKKGGDGSFGGKRGVVKGSKRKNRGMTQEQVDAFMRWVPERANKPLLHKHIEKAMAGSVKSLLWLHFMEENGFSPTNIRKDTRIGDPLYNLRPYKDDDGADADFEPEPSADENEGETPIVNS